MHSAVPNSQKHGVRPGNAARHDTHTLTNNRVHHNTWTTLEHTYMPNNTVRPHGAPSQTSGDDVSAKPLHCNICTNSCTEKSKTSTRPCKLHVSTYSCTSKTNRQHDFASSTSLLTSVLKREIRQHDLALLSSVFTKTRRTPRKCSTVRHTHAHKQRRTPRYVDNS